jgi:hypothetical protein
MQTVCRYFLALIQEAAQDLAPKDRELFLRAVAKRFQGWADKAADLIR